MAQISTDNPSVLSPTLQKEFDSFFSAAGAYDLRSRAKLALTGADRVRWLNGMMTNNIRDLAPGRGVYGFLLNPQGRILGDLYAYNRADSLMLDTDQSQVSKIWDHFDHYIIMDDVEVTDVSDKLSSFGIAGPASPEVLGRAGIIVPELQPLQFIDLTWLEAGITVVRGDNPLVESYEVWVGHSNFDALWNKVIEAGTTAISQEALNLLRIASGTPLYGVDIRERDLPQETEQDRALNFSKGCYIGQEIVERIRSRGSVHRKFTGFQVEGVLPSPGTKIQVDGKEAGEITSSAVLPFESGQLPVALGYIRREHAVTGKNITAGEARLEVSELPFRKFLKR